MSSISSKLFFLFHLPSWFLCTHKLKKMTWIPVYWFKDHTVYLPVCQFDILYFVSSPTSNTNNLGRQRIKEGMTDDLSFFCSLCLYLPFLKPGKKKKKKGQLSAIHGLHQIQHFSHILPAVSIPPDPRTILMFCGSRVLLDCLPSPSRLEINNLYIYHFSEKSTCQVRGIFP